MRSWRRLGPRKVGVALVIAVAVLIVAAVADDPALGLGVGVLLLASAGSALLTVNLIREVRELRRVVEQLPSKGTRAPAAAPDPPAGSAKPEPSHAGWLSHRLWGGFVQEGLRRLEAHTRDPGASSGERSRAYRELARWWFTWGDHERALTVLRHSRVADPRASEHPAGCALEADVLVALQRPEEARQALERAGDLSRDPHLLLRWVNTLGGDAGRPRSTSETKRLGALNRLLVSEGFAPLSLRDVGAPLSLDNLTVDPDLLEWQRSEDQPLVSVIVPVHDDGRHLGRCLRSLTAQTYARLEILVVDDASSDDSAAVAQAWAETDGRVQLIRRESNGGTYRARNDGLGRATGQLITTHDADDWSHPQKIEAQVRQLLRQPDLVGDVTHWVRVDQRLVVQQPTLLPRYERVSGNRSSLMVRTCALGIVGGWDVVSSAADSEMLQRLQRRFGEESIEWLYEHAPLSFGLSSDRSLTSASSTGLLSLNQHLGARRQYVDAFKRWHASPSFEAQLPFDPEARPFVRPAILEGGELAADRSRFDVVIMSNMTLPGGTTSSNVEELEALVAAGRSVALLHHPVFEWSVSRPINEKIRTAAERLGVRFLSVGEYVETDLLVLRLPKVAEVLLDAMPEIAAEHVAVVVNQTPWRGYGEEREVVYELALCRRNLEERFGSSIEWFPNGPLVREVLDEHHREELAGAWLAAEDWYNIIDLDAWRRTTRPPPGPAVRIGRHSRDAETKWPPSAAAITQAYPVTDGFEVRVLGGAEVPAAVLGRLPDNWTVLGFDTIEPREFLADLDVYVYMPHPDLREAFGRALLEPLAVGVPVIAPPVFEPLFGDAVLYAQPEDVVPLIEDLMADDQLYARQVRRGHELVRKHFSYEAHVRRVERLTSRGASDEATPMGELLPTGS